MEQILIVEDDTDINNMMASALTKAGYECKQSFSGTEAIMNYLSSGNVGLLSMASGGSLYLKALLIAIITLILMGSLSGLMMQKKDI